MMSLSRSCFSFLFRICVEKLRMNIFTLLKEAKEQLELSSKDWVLVSGGWWCLFTEGE